MQIAPSLIEQTIQLPNVKKRSFIEETKTFLNWSPLLLVFVLNITKLKEL